MATTRLFKKPLKILRGFSGGGVSQMDRWIAIEMVAGSRNLSTNAACGGYECPQLRTFGGLRNALRGTRGQTRGSIRVGPEGRRRINDVTLMPR
jgi:hypothetical protein